MSDPLTEGMRLGTAILKIADIKLRRKYKKKWMNLKDDYFKEKSNPGKVDMALLDGIDRELAVLNLAMADEIMSGGQ